MILTKPINSAHSPSAARELPKKLVDIQQLESWWGPDAMSLLRRLAPMFVARYSSQIELLQQAIADQDAAEVRNIAHSMRSSYSNVGVQELAERMRSLEEAAIEEDMVTVAQHFEYVVSKTDQVLDELNAL